jgi:hypothetical protein
MRMRLTTIALLAAGPLALVSAIGAQADVQTSNWSGYAVHRAGVRFREVEAAWKQPSASCSRGRKTYSSFWVGLGGLRRGARALEQVGTEMDCTASGEMRAAAWYEVVPAATRWVRLPISVGDTIAASVSVHGHTVTFTLADFSTGRSFDHTVHAARLDTSSADWIAEEPSSCAGSHRCRTLPLANFGSVEFTHALARSASGHSGTIIDPAWSASRIRLQPRARQANSSGHGSGSVVASALQNAGSAFQVVFTRAG